MKTKLVESSKMFILEEKRYLGILDKIEYFENPKKKSQCGQKFFFVILDDKELEKGEGTSYGKRLNASFWAAGKNEDDPDILEFGKRGPWKNCVENLLTYKGIDIDEWDGETDSLLGGCVRFMVKVTDEDEKGRRFNNIVSDDIKPFYKDSKAKKEEREKIKETVKQYKIWLKEQEKDDDEDEPKAKKEVKKESKKKDDDEEFADEKPAKKQVKKQDEDEDFVEEKKPAKKEVKKESKKEEEDFFDVNED